MKSDLITQLTALDVAPQRHLTEAEARRRDDLLVRILAEPSTGRTSAARPALRRRPTLWMGVAVAGGLAVVVAAAVVVAGALPVARRLMNGNPGIISAAGIAAWTRTPSGLDPGTDLGTAARRYCLRNATGRPGNTATPVISNADTRGVVATMVVTRGDDVTFCLFDRAGTGLTEADDPVPTLAADAVALDSSGAHGNGDLSFGYAVGFAGSAVTAVTLRASGRTIEATLSGGRWTAWWPAPDSQLDEVAVALTDGGTRVVEGRSLYR